MRERERERKKEGKSRECKAFLPGPVSCLVSKATLQARATDISDMSKTPIPRKQRVRGGH